MGKYFLIPLGWGELTRPSLPYSAVWRWPLLPHSKGGMYLENRKLDSSIKFDIEIWAYYANALDQSARLVPRHNINTMSSWADTFALVASDTQMQTWTSWHIDCTQSHISVAAFARLLLPPNWHQCIMSVCCFVLIRSAVHVYLNSSDTSVGVCCRSQIFVLRNIPLKYCALCCALSWITILFSTLRPKEQLDRKTLLGAVFSTSLHRNERHLNAIS